MFHCLAQATQPVPVSIPETWSPAAVVMVATILAGLFATTIVPAIIALMNSWQAKREARKAVEASNVAREVSAEAKGKTEVLVDSARHLANTNERQQSVLDSMQQKMPPK